MKQPIIICGPHGGGTSFTTKMLRFSGLFVGADVEPFSARKFHESKCFRDINMRIFKVLGGDIHCGSENCLRRYVRNFQNDSNVNNLLIEIERSKDQLLNTFSSNDMSLLSKPWGWKDPRNSINLFFWTKIFPDSKILMIKKDERNKKSKSASGRWFRTCSEYERNFYFNPSSVFDLNKCSQEVKVVNFEEITTKQEKFDDMLEYCELGSVELRMALKECGYEG